MKSKLITLVMGLLLAASALAVDSGGNSVYIDQTNADMSAVSITQTGSDNILGGTSASDAFVIDGNSVTFTASQNGMGNAIYGNFIGTGSTGTITQDGNSNTTTLNMGNLGTDGGTLAIGVTGNNNATALNIGVTGNASNYIYNLGITGDTNVVASNVNSTYTVNNITVAGSRNTITTTQTGAGGSSTSAGHSLTINNIGSDNTITALQNGTTTPNSAIINVTGNSSTVSVIQH
jgi:hypothetical protein